MGVDIDIGDAVDAVAAAQCLDQDAGIIEYAEAGRDVAAGMVQAGDRNEGAPHSALHDIGQCGEHAAGDRRGSLEYPFEGRRVAGIEKAVAGFGLSLHAPDICGGMKAPQRRFISHDRRGGMDPLLQGCTERCAPECIRAIRPERMIVAEAVAGQRCPDAELHGGAGFGRQAV